MAIPRIAFDGGPCGGKSVVIEYLKTELPKHGVKPFIVPEAATELIMSGFRIGPKDLTSSFFQELILKHIIAKEDLWYAAALAHPAALKVIICDRGAMSGQAYISATEFRKLLVDLDMSVIGLRDRRYDGVIHLHTAALGAEKFYTCGNNAARKETPAQARKLNNKTLNAWIGHPHLRVIPNGQGGIEEKKQIALSHILHMLGLPVPVEIERKFVVENFSRSLLKNMPHFVVEIFQRYLHDRHGAEERVRSRGVGEDYVLYHTKKLNLSGYSRQEIETVITEEEFQRLLYLADSEYRTIAKKRICFVYKDQYFELDVITEPKKLVVLEIELLHEHQPVHLPPFLKLKEVTGDPKYSNRTLAKI